MSIIENYKLKIKEIRKRIIEIDEQMEECNDADSVELALAKVEELKSLIKNYLNKMSSILLKVAKLSNNKLVVKNGNIVYNGDLKLPKISITEAEDYIPSIINQTNSLLKTMSMEGVKEPYLSKLGVCLHTFYYLYGNMDEGLNEFEKVISGSTKGMLPKLKKEKKALEVELAKYREAIYELEEENERILEESSFKKLEIEKNYVTSLTLSYAVGNGEAKVFDLANDGILGVVNEDEDNELMPAFVKTMFTKFLFSYPNLEKQILYLSKKSNNEINNYLTKLQTSLGKNVFFRDSVRLSTYDFESEFKDVLDGLRNTLEERTVLLDKECLDNILDYNKFNQNDIKQPILVIINSYPFGFKNFIDFDYFLKNGPKAGIYFITIQNKENLNTKSYLDEEVFNPLDYSKEMLRIENDSILIEDSSYELIEADNVLLDKLITKLVKVKKNSGKVLSYLDVGFGKEKIDPIDVKESISIPIGKIENKTYNIEFAVSGKDEAKPIAYLLIGSPMMGKSSLIDSMIFNGAMKYSPDDLEFYLIDFKDGVSSATYGSIARMPHIKVLAESSKQEEAEIILKTLIKEQARRNNIFKKHNCRNLADYNAIAEKHLPRIIVVIDEVQKLFKEDESDYGRADRLAKDLESIVREARSVGIHLVLASQDASRKMMSCVGKFVPGRFCFGAALEDAENILNRANALRVVTECTKPGIALVSHNSGNDCQKIRLAYHENKEAIYATEVREKWNNYEVDIAIVGDDSSLYVTDVFEEKEIFSDEVNEVPVGESYYDHSIINLTFNDYNHSLLLVGENEDIQTDIIKSTIIGALRMKSKVLLLDESRTFELADTFGGHPDVTTYESNTYLEMLNEAYAEFKKRSKNRRAKYDPYFLVLDNLSMVNDFVNNTKYKAKTSKVTKKDEEDEDLPDWYNSSWKDDYSFDEDSEDTYEVYGAESLIEIISSLNKANNFYVIIAVDKATSIRRYSSTLSDCDYKIIHAPYVESMEQIIGNLYKKSIVSSCNDNLALLSEKGQAFIKFRYFKYDNSAKSHYYIRRLGRK